MSQTQHPTQSNNPQHRGGDRPRLGLPSDAKPVPPAPPKELPPAVTPNGSKILWHPMEQAPKDGTYVFLREVGKGGRELPPREWYYYATRQFRKGSWQPCGWWRERFGPNSPPDFTPSGFRRVSEGLGH